MVPYFSATSSYTRHILTLLRCISFDKRAQVRMTTEGLRFSTEDSSFMESFVFLDKGLFTSYTFNPPPPPSSQDDPPDPPIFEINLPSLLEALGIFSLSDPNANKRPGDYDGFAAHRLNRHSNINAFLNPIGTGGVCTFTYEGEGNPLSVYMADANVTTTCDLTTYEADNTEEIPFNRDELALKTIMLSDYLRDAVSELNSMNPEALTILATPASGSGPNLSLSASGALGSVAVEFTTDTPSETPILETFHCPSKTCATFKFALIKAAYRAMSSATKVSMRLDEEGVLNLQFLIQIETVAGQDEKVAFVDFRVVPLVEGEGETEEVGGIDSESE
jgi:cell cycle checkpoint protein